MPMPRVKMACLEAVLNKAMVDSSMGEWAFNWLKEFTEEQPALATQLSHWITSAAGEIDDGVLTNMTAMIGIMVKSIESQIECDELIEELGV